LENLRERSDTLTKLFADAVELATGG